MAPSPPKHPWLGLAVFLVLCFGVATLGGIATTPNIPNWYAGLAKPGWTPPNWIFGPVWSVLYFSMAIAAWLVWQKGSALVPLTLFGVQLALNVRGHGSSSDCTALASPSLTSSSSGWPLPSRWSPSGGGRLWRPCSSGPIWPG